MIDPELRGVQGPALLRRMRLANEQVEPAPTERPGATAIERLLVRSTPPGISGLELLAEQRAWNMALSSDPSRVPQGPHLGQSPQLPRFVVILLAMMGIAGALYLLRELSWLIAPAFLALNMVIVVYPVQTFLRRRGLPKSVAVTFTGLTLVAVLAVFSGIGFWAVSEMVSTIPQYLTEVNALYASAVNLLVGWGVERDAITQALAAISPENLLGAAPEVFSGFSGIVAMVGVVLSAIIMMMLDVPSWGNRIAVAGSTHPRIVAGMREFSEGVRRYWLVCTIFGALMAGINYVQLVILGVPLPVVWALLTWLMTYVPSIGFFFSLIPPLLVALAANGWQNALWLLGVYLLTTWIIQGIFQPKITGNAIGVNATVALLSLLLWAWVFGPLGALIAMPCTQLVKALMVDADPKARWVNSLLASRAEVRGAAAQS